MKNLSLDVYGGEIYGERHNPVEEGSKVWLKPRPDGHSAWASNWSHKEAAGE